MPGFVPAFLIMSLRFDYIVSKIRPDSIGTADIGTDHGYVPVMLAKSGYSGNIIASDINIKPLKKAIRNAEAESLSDRIDFVLSDGLSNIDRDKIDTVVICGMGAELICRILDNCEWILDRKYSLILQPASRPEILVYWLDNNGFNITEDRFICENGRLFRFISCRFENTAPKASEVDLFCGLRAVCKDNELYLYSLKKCRRIINSIIQGMNTSVTDFSGELSFYTGLLGNIDEVISEVDNGKQT